MSMWQKIDDEEVKKLLEQKEKETKYEWKSMGKRVVEEFLKANLDSATIDYKEVKKRDGTQYYKSASGCARALGRVLKSNKATKNYRIFASGDKVVILKPKGK